MTKGIFGDMFDFNKDGQLDAGEKAMEFMFLDQLTKKVDENDSDNDDEE